MAGLIQEQCERQLKDELTQQEVAACVFVILLTLSGLDDNSTRISSKSCSPKDEVVGCHRGSETPKQGKQTRISAETAISLSPKLAAAVD